MELNKIYRYFVHCSATVSNTFNTHFRIARMSVFCFPVPDINILKGDSTMKRITIVGTKDVNFTDQQTGRVVEGRSYFFTEEDARTQGVQTGKLFLSIERLAQLGGSVPKLGETVKVCYDQYGRVDEFFPVK